MRTIGSSYNGGWALTQKNTVVTVKGVVSHFVLAHNTYSQELHSSILICITFSIMTSA